MNIHRQQQASEAEKALRKATEELERALKPEADSEDSTTRWARVRALQAQAQLQILHSISWDLDAISDAIHDRP